MSKVPLKTVAFIRAVSVPGCDVMMTTVTAMESRLVAGSPFVCPQPYLDREAETIVVGDREFPLHLVHFYERAQMAKSKMPEPSDYSQYTVGKREPRRIVIPVETRPSEVKRGKQ